MKSAKKTVNLKADKKDVNLDDCYYYYYSACRKGDSCSFRHEPASVGNETMCLHWLRGKCIRPHCNFRHMEISKNRSKIPCYHESQPAGCLKQHCPFLHKGNRPNLLGSNFIKGNLEDDISMIKLKSQPKEGKRCQSPKERSESTDDSSSDSEKNTSSKLRKVNAFLLAQALSDEKDLQLSVSTILKKYSFVSEKVVKLASENDSTFVINGDIISLRPKIKFCYDYYHGEGCSGFNHSKVCSKLHICTDYIIGKCSDADCLYGHNLLTNHNKFIVDHFKLSLLTQHALLKVLRDFRFSSKKDLNICSEYNKDSCQLENCKNLHICLKSLANICPKGDNCDLNHDLNSKDVLDIVSKHGINVKDSQFNIYLALISSVNVKAALNTLKSGKKDEDIKSEGNLKSIKKDEDIKSKGNCPLKTVWSHEFNGDVPVAEICYDSVKSYCPKELSGCPKLHCNTHFYWQIKSSENVWVNFPFDHVLSLEKAYCNPAIEKLMLPPLDPTSLQSSSRELLHILKGKSIWEVDFENMHITLIVSPKERLMIRRLCTEYNFSLPEPCVFAWYFLDISNSWVEYGKSGIGNLKSDIKSQDIEKIYKGDKKSITFKNEKYTYLLDIVDMTQKNLNTGVVRSLRRRPIPHLKENDSSVQLPDYWEPMNKGERVRRVILSPHSNEYKKILSSLIGLGGKQVKSIERVQAPYFYKAFLNRAEEMRIIYGSVDSVNIQRLFHGTNPETVSKICEENFDWRLHGTNVGQVYGRGTYFSPNADVSYKYTISDNSGYRYIFVAKVAVGSITLGSNNLARPPINPQTNKPFDSTADKIHSPTKIVKYDKQEYYPEYIITIS